MKKLATAFMPPTHIQRFEFIRDNKHSGTVRATLISNRTAICTRFAAYDMHFLSNTLENISPSPLLTIKDELRSCYSDNVFMRQLKNDFKAAQGVGRLAWCPYCGITTPTSYDHYLPADIFPEFAAHALNLVPACSKCNSAKGKIWITGGVRQFIHFYLDDIPVLPYLSVQLVSDHAVRAVGAVFSFAQAGMPASIWAVMEPHFCRLGLIERYNQEANTLVNEALRVSNVYLTSGGANAALFLATRAADQANLFGPYDLRAVLWRAMSTDPDLLVWISWL